MRRRTILGTRVVATVLSTLVISACGSSKHASSAASTPATPTGRSVSGQLVGVDFGGPVLGLGVDLGRQLDMAVASGVESVRIVADWSRLQPYATDAQVPPAARSQFVDAHGVPTRFVDLDRIVGAAAARGISVLPVVEYSPGWAALHPGGAASPPRSTGPYAALLTTLVDRYGPRGSYWSTHPRAPRTPIRMWQIWNEPHFASYWSDQPFAPAYVKLLGAAHAAIKQADPGAKVVLGGLADFSWRYLAQIYRVPGASRLFDIVALHPYTAQPAGVIVIMQRARAVMNQFGDHDKPILATEITWPSSEGKAPPQFGVSTTEAGQAARLSQAMPLLVANRAKLGLMGFYWFTWMGDETARAKPDGFGYAGLLKYVGGAVLAKPALAAFRRQALAIEGCRTKRSASRCGA